MWAEPSAAANEQGQKLVTNSAVAFHSADMLALRRLNECVWLGGGRGGLPPD